jgi:heat shock protein HslJ
MRIAAVVVCALLLSGCGMFGGPVGGDDEGELAGRTFLSVAVEENGAPRPLVEGTQVSLDFGPDGNLGARAGCNTIIGTWRLVDGTLVFGGGGMTEMGCDPELHAQDDWLVEFLGAEPAARLAGQELVLTAGSTVMTLMDRETVEPDRPLTGAPWQVESLYLEGDAVSSVPAGASATLEFQDDGTLLVDGGCNKGRATWSMDGSTMRIGPLAMTRMFCEGAPGELEQHVVSVLDSETLSVSIEAATLTLKAGELGLGLRQHDPSPTSSG